MTSTYASRRRPRRAVPVLCVARESGGLYLKGYAEGIDAATINAVLDAASPSPKRGERRGPQLMAGLLGVLADWATGHHHRPDPDSGEAPRPHVTIHLLVDENTTTDGAAAELWTSLPGLAPTITAEPPVFLDQHGDPLPF